MAGLEWKEQLAARRKAMKMVVEEVGIDKITPWVTALIGAFISFVRGDGKFFKMIGVMIYGAGREVAGWGQPLLEEAGAGVYVIVTTPARDLFLVTMREEPGNPADKQHVLLGPPLQASLGNWTQTHGGKRPSGAEFYDGCTSWVDVPKDGGRFRNITGQNINRMGILVVDEVYFLQYGLEVDQILMTRAELKEAFLAGECNPYLREAGMALL